MKTCLIVDDSQVVRKVACRIVRDLGFTAIEAQDGQVALDSCKDKMPDAILLDWNMPVMNGLDFLKALRAMNGAAQPKVIFCTIETSAKHIKRAMKAGADEYIMKPFDGEIIAGKFQHVGLIESAS